MDRRARGGFGVNVGALIILGSILTIVISMVIGIIALLRRGLSPRRTLVVPLSQEPPQIEARSVAAQLGQADQLLGQGHISQAEYVSLRARLLGIERPPDE
jgi:hypothetical protein